MTMSTSCPLVIANRTCLSRYSPSPSWKKKDESRQEEADRSNFSRRSNDGRWTVRRAFECVYYRPLAIPTSVSTSRMTGVPIIFGSFRGPSRASGSQFFNDSPSLNRASIDRNVSRFEEKDVISFPLFRFVSILLEEREISNNSNNSTKISKGE